MAEVSPTDDQNSRTFLIQIDLPPSTQLRSGQFGHVAVPLPSALTLQVPAAAVAKRGQMEIVFVVQDGKAMLRLVRTGKRFGPDGELLAGANAGDQVIISAADSLRDGQPVEVE